VDGKGSIVDISFLMSVAAYAGADGDALRNRIWAELLDAYSSAWLPLSLRHRLSPFLADVLREDVKLRARQLDFLEWCYQLNEWFQFANRPLVTARFVAFDISLLARVDLTPEEEHRFLDVLLACLWH